MHPDYFCPDLSIYQELGICPGEKYVVLRFGSFNAFHDFKERGFPLRVKYDLVSKMEKYTKVYISSECALPNALKRYALSISPDRIHQVLYYAQLLVGDTGTMTSESALLGTPSIQYASSVRKFGNFIELGDKYGLICSFSDPEKVVNKAVDMIQRRDLKDCWDQKRKKLLAEKIDVTKYMIDLINTF